MVSRAQAAVSILYSFLAAVFFLVVAFLAGAFFLAAVAFLAGAAFLAVVAFLAGAFFFVEVDFFYSCCKNESRKEGIGQMLCFQSCFE